MRQGSRQPFRNKPNSARVSPFARCSLVSPSTTSAVSDIPQALDELFKASYCSSMFGNRQQETHILNHRQKDFPKIDALLIIVLVQCNRYFQKVFAL